MADSKTTPLIENRPISSLGSAIENSGPGQLLRALLVSFAWFFDAQQAFIAAVADAEPKWHLKGRNDDDAAADRCGLPRDAWAWDAPARASTVSDFGLECSGPLVAGLPATSFLSGCLIGGFLLATLADSRLGRKKMLSLSCLAMALSGLLTAAFSAGIWSYSLLRLAAGIARSTIGTTALVLSTELVGTRWRGGVGVAGFVFFALGFLSLPAVAYVNEDSSWRNLYVWTSLPAMFYSVVVHFFVVESPRWLFVQGRRQEAVAAMTFDCSSVRLEEETWNVDLYSALKVLVEKRWAFRRLSAVMAVGFGAGMVYYGMPLALGSLESDLYLSVALNALSELPASLLTVLLIGKLDRKSSILFFTSLGGASSLTLAVLKRQAVLASLHSWLELVSFFSACTAVNLMLVFTVELFPTCVRNSAVSMARQALVFGGAFGPPLAAAGSAGFVSYGVFGVAIGCCGLFVVCLHETRGRGICDTMDEEEKKMTN